MIGWRLVTDSEPDLDAVQLKMGPFVLQSTCNRIIEIEIQQASRIVDSAAEMTFTCAFPAGMKTCEGLQKGLPGYVRFIYVRSELLSSLLICLSDEGIPQNTIATAQILT